MYTTFFLFLFFLLILNQLYWRVHFEFYHPLSLYHPPPLLTKPVDATLRSINEPATKSSNCNNIPSFFCVMKAAKSAAACVKCTHVFTLRRSVEKSGNSNIVAGIGRRGLIACKFTIRGLSKGHSVFTSAFAFVL